MEENATYKWILFKKNSEFWHGRAFWLFAKGRQPPPPKKKKLVMPLGLYHATNPRKTFSGTRFEIAKRSKRCVKVSLQVTGHGEGFKIPHIQYQDGYSQSGTVYNHFLKHSPFSTKYSILNAETHKAR